LSVGEKKFLSSKNALFEILEAAADADAFLRREKKEHCRGVPTEKEMRKYLYISFGGVKKRFHMPPAQDTMRS